MVKRGESCCGVSLARAISQGGGGGTVWLFQRFDNGGSRPHQCGLFVFWPVDWLIAATVALALIRFRDSGSIAVAYRLPESCVLFGLRDFLEGTGWVTLVRYFIFFYHLFPERRN